MPSRRLHLPGAAVNSANQALTCLNTDKPEKVSVDRGSGGFGLRRQGFAKVSVTVSD
jgi:hypothetical protein